MLMTITLEQNQADDLSYLLHKHPAKVQAFDLSFGKAHVFYSEVSAARCTAALLLEIDTIHMIRGNKTAVSESSPLAQYVNDKPYVCSSFMSVAIAQVYGSALGGKCKDKPDLPQVELPLTVRLYSLPSRGGEKLLTNLFTPLGYEMAHENITLDEKFPEWGKSAYYNVTLRKTTTLQNFLAQLYILIPVLDKEKHYWVDEDEAEKLIAKGKDWLNEHPGRDFIVSRYLKGRKYLEKMAIAGLSPEEAVEDAEKEQAHQAQEEKLEATLNLNQQRLKDVVEKLKQHDAASVLDLGCGEGKLLRLLLKEKSFTRITGTDVSVRPLEIAAAKLRLDELSETQNKRVTIFQSSLMYRDKRFAGFDAICLIEVIEHMELDRVSALERVVFEFALPRLCIVTTPNSEYNSNFPNLPAGKFRHSDHRFEWTRAEFETWANGVARRFGYRVEFSPIGNLDPDKGAPTQMAVFVRN